MTSEVSRCRPTPAARSTGEAAMRSRLIIAVTFLASLIAVFGVTADLPAGDSSGPLVNGEWVVHTREALARAAMRSPKWESQQAEIERYLDDVGYALQSTAVSTHAADHATAAINARAAIRMLERGVQKQFFRRTDIEPILHRLGTYVTPRVPERSACDRTVHRCAGRSGEATQS